MHSHRCVLVHADVYVTDSRGQRTRTLQSLTPARDLLWDHLKITVGESIHQFYFSPLMPCWLDFHVAEHQKGHSRP